MLFGIDLSEEWRSDGNVRCRSALNSDLPHFRCRVKLRLKHPKAALALSKARNPPAIHLPLDRF
jgi:hypothetical protein